MGPRAVKTTLIYFILLAGKKKLSPVLTIHKTQRIGRTKKNVKNVYLYFFSFYIGMIYATTKRQN
jgi:hypothetical protein